jgi:hypothetical protein
MANKKLGDVANRLLFESDRVKVWEMDLAPGDSSDFHEHTLPYVHSENRLGSVMTFQTSSAEAEVSRAAAGRAAPKPEGASSPPPGETTVWMEVHQ